MSEIVEADRLGEWPHPREAAAFYGHAEAERALLRAINGRLPHAWILGGVKGVGKATLAWRVAKAMLARGRSTAPLDTLDVAPGDMTVRRVLAGAHPDLLSLRRPADPKTGKLKSELPVDEIRRLGDFFSRHASEGGWRVAIVDSADELNRNAANALLKTLEEPPPRGLLLLVSHRPRALLPTIRSRCRMLSMSPLSLTQTETALAAIAPDLPERAELTRMSGGSVGAALEMAANDAPALDRALDGIARRRGRDAAAAHALADELSGAAATGRFRLFLDRLQTAFAAAAANGDRDALAAWRLAGDLARAEEGLHIDRRAVILRLLERYAAAAG